MSKNSVTKNTFLLFLSHLSKYKLWLGSLLVSIPMTVLVLDFSVPYITSLVLDKISRGDFDQENLWGSFSGYIIAYSAATLYGAVLGWRLNIWLIWNLELRVVRDIAQRTFDHLISLSAEFHTNRFTGSLVSQANKLTGAYVRLFDTSIFNLYTLFIALLATVIILAPRAPVYVIVMIAFSAIYMIGTTYFSKAVRKANTKEAETQSKQTGYLADALTNILAIKSFSSEDYEMKRYNQIATETLETGRNSMRTTMVRETYSSFITSSISIASIVIAVVGAGVYNADIATLFLIVSFTANIGHRLWEFQNVLRQYNRALGDASDMIKIFQIKPGIKDLKTPEKSKIGRGKVVFNKVKFSHNEAGEVLFENLNLKIKAGEKIGLIGRSGSGKTTLTKLVLRFIDVDDGSIEIDGQNIRYVKQSDLRKYIAYVPQEPLLFHRSIAENISYGNKQASLRQIKAVAKLAHADEFIDKLPLKYKTLVGERGVKLSGGQRQRIAIARAMIKNAPILLLDEATSALDSESENLIQDALWKLMEGKTAIVIAHRLSTIQKMDRIIVLDNGRIVEQGSHKELLWQKGAYAELWKHQSGGFLED